MAVLTETDSFPPVRVLQTSPSFATLVENENLQAQDVANRTNYIKKRLNNVNAILNSIVQKSQYNDSILEKVKYLKDIKEDLRHALVLKGVKALDSYSFTTLVDLVKTIYYVQPPDPIDPGDYGQPPRYEGDEDVIWR
jgi:hypothetical protein